MTERERLIELLRKDAACDTADCEKCLTKKNCYQILTADYLLNNGVIVPPCKVGDIVYRKLNDGSIISRGIINIDIYKDEILIIDDSLNKYFPEDFGKKVFLSKEEAEKALEDMKK